MPSTISPTQSSGRGAAGTPGVLLVMLNARSPARLHSTRTQCRRVGAARWLVAVQAGLEDHGPPMGEATIIGISAYHAASFCRLSAPRRLPDLPMSGCRNGWSPRHAEARMAGCLSSTPTSTLSTSASSVACVDRAFPEYAVYDLKPTRDSGSSNALFRLGDNMLVRMPRQPGGGASIDKEARWLSFVGPRITVAVPRILGVGEPDLGYASAGQSPHGSTARAFYLRC